MNILNMNLNLDSRPKKTTKQTTYIIPHILEYVSRPPAMPLPESEQKILQPTLFFFVLGLTH